MILSIPKNEAIVLRRLLGSECPVHPRHTRTYRSLAKKGLAWRTIGPKGRAYYSISPAGVTFLRG